jgi:2-polyprenyl-6-methoxyphenol hydroxylase-like FAD-dependent oxidoreductase
MKIIIVGGGLGGLASYLALKKYLAEISHSVTIKVYESHPDPISATATLGGSISIAPNGLRALSSICDAAVTSLTATGFQYPTFAFHNSRGSLLGHYVSGSKERHGFVQLFVTRTMVHEALLREVPQSAVHWGKNVEKVVEATNDDGVEVHFADGTVEHADLVIGADGLKSVVRKSIFGDEFDAKYK